MKRSSGVIAALLIAISPSVLFCTSPEREPKEGYLWEISGNGLTEPSYLFGTFHGTFDISYNYVDSIPGYHAAFDKARLVCGEIAPHSMDDVKNAAEMPKWMEPMPADSTYRDLLSPEDYRYLDSTVVVLVKELGYGDSAQIMTMRPMMLSYSMSQAAQIVKLKKRGMELGSVQVMDMQIMKVAEERSKTVTGFETVAEQMEMLFVSGKSLREEARMFVYGLKQQGMTDSVAADIVAAYRSGELKEMERYGVRLDSLMATVMSAEDMEEYNSWMDKLIRGRNEKWMEKIPEMIAGQPTFIAVGARHLPTKTGLIEMLREKGYTVRAVN